MLEKEGNKEECIMFYEQAADLFHTENSMAEANKCNLKVRLVKKKMPAAAPVSVSACAAGVCCC